MALPQTGSLALGQVNEELKKPAESLISLDDTDVRTLAEKPTGTISVWDLFGKSAEIVKTLPSGGNPVTLQSLFTVEEWESPYDKRVIIPEGVERGTTSTSQAAVTVGTNGWKGRLALDVGGAISGAGGAANGGAGGVALDVNRKGVDDQNLIVAVREGGVIRGGGGGGGTGGVGGDGSYTGVRREPASGEYYQPSYNIYIVGAGLTRGVWFGAQIFGGENNEIYGHHYSYTIGAWTYYAGARHGGAGNYNYHAVYRTTPAAMSSTGGAGGSGGQGQGYTQSLTNGANGVNGGTNAGAGGKGGNGGAWGAAGDAGAQGANGNVTAGALGAGGGAAGFAIQNADNATLSNSGSVLGRV